MRIRILYFTDKGKTLAEYIGSALSGHDTEIVPKGSSVYDVCADAFRSRDALIFIGAAGIAVRYIAPYLQDKLHDPPVIVIDEAGSYVIPVLSGHVGGANELSCEIARLTGAEPVITTATDINGKFAVDLFALENDLRIINREGIAKVSSKSLQNKAVTLSIKNYPPEEHIDVLITDDAADPFRDVSSIILCPKRYAVGIGCRRGKSPEDIAKFAEKILAENNIEIDDIGAIATIDIKKDEEGLIRLSQYWRVPLLTFDAQILARVQGDFASSERVLEAVGVDNVCERAAVCAAGTGSALIVRKTAENGITVAVAERSRR